MKLVPLSKLDKKNTMNSKKFCDDAMSSSFFQFTVDWEQSGSRILNVWSIIYSFSLITTFYLTKAEKRTKKF